MAKFFRALFQAILSNPVWLLAGWCELRQDFRNFRLDRIQSLSALEEFFTNDPEKNLQAYVSKVECDDLLM